MIRKPKVESMPLSTSNQAKIICKIIFRVVSHEKKDRSQKYTLKLYTTSGVLGQYRKC